MRRAAGYISVLLFITPALAGPLLAQAPIRTIRVATVGHVGTQRALTVTTQGAWRLIDLGDHRLVSEGTGPAEWRFRNDASGKVRLEADLPSHSGGDGSTAATRRWPEISGAGIRIEGVATDQRFTVSSVRGAPVYPGAVEIWPSGQHSGSGLRLINEAPIELYLTGVVTAEGSASFEPEALKALAVAARSYAERHRLRHLPDADVCDTVHCQVYPGVGHVPDKIAQAVADTTGIVGLWGGAVIDAVFSADCGGRTRNSEDVWTSWGRVPYLRSVDDRPPNGGPDYCSVYRNHAYHLRLPTARLERLLGLPSGARPPLELAQVVRDSSGRLTALRLEIAPTIEPTGTTTAGSGRVPASSGSTPDGVPDEPLPCELLEGATKSPAPSAGPVTRSLTLTQLRSVFGEELRGRLIDSVLCMDGSLDLEGRGWGHGVGLCQWGAQGMALPPYRHTFDEILRHYYTGITLGPVPVRSARLSVQLQDERGQPLAGVSFHLVASDAPRTTDSQGRWEGLVPEGTYTLQAERDGATVSFYAVRVLAGRSGETRAALIWPQQDGRVAQRPAHAPRG